MATASSNANTNVAMMGETFKYVAPVAGAMGYKIEDVSLALGLMANNSIKASQGGTSLRTILTNMAKPTDEISEAMNYLELSLQNGEGKMKSLYEILEDLRGAFKTTKMPIDEFQRQLAKVNSDYEQGAITEKDYNEFLDDYEKHNSDVDLTREEMDIIEDYTEGGYISINGVSRGEKETQKLIEKHIMMVFLQHIHQKFVQQEPLILLLAFLTVMDVVE